MVLVIQITSKAPGNRRHAPYQRDALVPTFLVGQLKARLPVACRLAASQFVDLPLGGQILYQLGVGSP